LNADDSVLEGIYNKQFALKEFTDPSTFKSYSELNLKLTRVLGEELVTRNETDHIDQDIAGDADNASEQAFIDAAPVAKVESSTDDTMSYFAKLAAEA
jgi:hypothetical protein